MLRNILLALVAVPFLFISMKAMLEFGYLGIWQQGLLNSGTQQITLDLIIAASFGLGWVKYDAKRQGLNPWPWMVAVLPLGSIAFLGYFAYRAIAGERQGETWKPSAA